MPRRRISNRSRVPRKKRAQASYESQYADFRQDRFPDMFTTFQVLREARSFYGDMIKLKLWDRYVAQMNEMCEFVPAASGGVLNNNVIVMTKKAVWSCFMQCGPKYHQALLVALQFSCSHGRRLLGQSLVEGRPEEPSKGSVVAFAAAW